VFEIRVEADATIDMLAKILPRARRAAERALDQTARDIKAGVRQAMPQVFDRPTPYTLNSLQVTPTRNHNMQASVWFKTPDRMGDHYLTSQVYGGLPAYKGFERAFGDQEFVPGQGARIDRYGNVTAGQIRQILSVLGKAERAAGSQQNITARSARRNKKQRDYVYLPKGSGKLPPGVYERVARAGQEIDAKTSRRLGITGARAYQYGRSRGKWQSVTRARGLRPILIHGRRAAVKPRLPFFELATAIYDQRFAPLFYQYFNQSRGSAR
jgi:hypothetical protein